MKEHTFAADGTTCAACLYLYLLLLSAQPASKGAHLCCCKCKVALHGLSKLPRQAAQPPSGLGVPAFTHDACFLCAVFVLYACTLSLFPGVLAEDLKSSLLGSW